MPWPPDNAFATQWDGVEIWWEDGGLNGIGGEDDGQTHVVFGPEWQV